MIDLPLFVWYGIGFLVWSGLCYLAGFIFGMRHKEIVYIRKRRENNV